MASFEKGNKGKERGTKSTRIQQWEDLNEAIIDRHAGRFNQILGDMMESKDVKRQERGAELFIQVLEYFRPKQARIQHAGNDDGPINIIISQNL